MQAIRRSPRAIPAGKLVAVDTETTGLNYWLGDQPYAVSFCNAEGETGYYEWPVDPFTRQVQYDPRELRELRRWFFDKTITRVWFNGKFDRGMIVHGMDLPIRGRNEEVQFAAHVCNSMERPLALKPLSDKYLGISQEDQARLKEAVKKARRIGKKLGYKLSCNQANGKSSPEADYWMVRLVLPELAHLVKRYAVMDAERTMLLWLLYDELMDELGLRDTYDMEMQLEPIVEGMESRGLHYRQEDNERLRLECVKEREASLQELRQLSGNPDFDPAKPNHVRELLYEKGDERGVLPKGLTTKTGLPSTAYKYVQLFKDRSMVKVLLRQKSATKGITTYFRVFENLKQADPWMAELGRNDCWMIHHSYKQCGPRTGRFSSSGAGNLQNIPDGISTRAGKTVRGRDIFGPRPGFLWWLADYSQLEVRIFADVSQEPTLLDALAHDRDIHTEAANKAWGNERGIVDSRATLGLSGVLVNESNYHEHEKLHKVHERMGLSKRMLFGRLSQRDQERVAREWLESYDWNIVKAEDEAGFKHARAKAKILLFCRMFGGGPNAIKDLMYVSYEQAKQFLEDYARAFPRMTDFIYELTAQAKADGFIETRFGRRLMVPPEKPYKGVNYLVQGSAAGLMKLALIKVGDYLKGLGIDAYLVMTIHDELIIECAKEEARKSVIHHVKKLMEDHEGAFGIPMPVEVSKTTERWPDKSKMQVEYRRDYRRVMRAIKKKQVA